MPVKDLNAHNLTRRFARGEPLEGGVAVDVLTLPCMRDRHGACAGAVRIGITIHQREHECFCSCHTHPAQGNQRVVSLATGSIPILPV